METVIRLKASELNLSFINKLKAFITKDTELEIKVPSSATRHLSSEAQEVCNRRIETAIDDVEKGKDLVRFTSDEFDIYMTNLLKK